MSGAQPSRWLALFALGALPLALWGFFTSAAANRPPFAAWGAVATLAWTAALRLGLARGWSRERLAAALCLTAAAGLGALAGLLALWSEDLALGLAAVAPALPAGPLSSPWGALGVAAGLAVTGGIAWAASRERGTSQ